MFKATKVLQMQPSRMLFMKQTAPLFMRQTAPLYMRQTSRMMKPAPKEEHGAHTISQRIRSLKKLPAELIPLFIVVGVAIFAAIFSIGRKFYVDKTLRLKRQGKLE
ncbi:hypothetical protein K491DRAFT_652941 [Lophiostoma macrostomum CBS 122681]|uniref:Uncharacterized protein n=1 Tax=Lophiostoma macrostomum CBS 122681 TaxID=1314788 RepID=A0A6A6TG30_9PLEO|nr:hypothetical protein K491DRAFT_652941 [Lophiostoma macrostomum CBS 122681]